MTRVRGVFVTGTDTGVGKTVVAAGLVGLLRKRGERVAVLKPVETGFDETTDAWPEDGRMLATAAGLDLETTTRSAVVPYVFRDPLAPLIAARREGRPIKVDAIARAYERSIRDASFSVVEGAGGLSVSVTEDVDMAGLAVLLGLPIVIVARPSLGTLNHTFLTVEYARHRGLQIVGIIISGSDLDTDDLAEQTNPAALEERCGLPVLAQIPRRDGLATAADAIEAVSGALDLDLFFTRLDELEVTAAATPPSRVRSSR